MWEDLLDQLYRAVIDSNAYTPHQQVSQEFKLRFCAHMAIMLMLHNRISAQRTSHGPSPIDKYNKIVSEYIISIAESNTLPEEQKLKTIPFYVSMLVGDFSQRDTYAKVMVKITDNGSMKVIRKNNEAYFIKEMCTRIIHSVPTLAIYEGDDREVYLRKNWRHVRGEHIQFVGALDQEDQESMDVLQWLQTKNDLSATIGFYVELARKFLS